MRGGPAVGRRGSWRLRAPPSVVLRFLLRHPVPGYTGYRGLGRFFNESERGNRGDQYQGTVLRRHGWTLVQIDVWSTWTYPPLPHEVVPSSVREVDIRQGLVDLAVTGARNVKPIVRWFDQLSVIPPVNYGVTGYDYQGQWVQFTFRTAGRVQVASSVVPADIAANVYYSISFVRHGKQLRPLQDSGPWKSDFINRVQRLLGVCFGFSQRVYRFSLACNKGWADNVANNLLRRLRLPSDAQSVAHEPDGDSGRLRSPASVPATGELLDRHRFWRVRGSVASVEAFVATHEPLAAKAVSSTTGGRRMPAIRNVTLHYSDITLNHRPASRETEVTLVALRGGWTGVRADGQVAWDYPRPSFTRLHRVGVAIVVRAGSTTRRITGSRLLKLIVARFNRLPVVPPGRVYPCPATKHRGQRITIEFHGHESTPHAVVYGMGSSTACNPIHFSGYGDSASLIGGDFVRWLLESRF